MAQDAGQRKLLEHELKVAKSLDHPTIIKIDRLSEEGGLPHLVMEYFPHPNLKKQIAAGVDALAPRLQRIVTETALALDHMHARGWVHRDVKPDNVLAAADGQVKLIDLAIAARTSGLLGKLLGGKTAGAGVAELHVARSRSAAQAARCPGRHLLASAACSSNCSPARPPSPDPTPTTCSTSTSPPRLPAVERSTATPRRASRSSSGRCSPRSRPTARRSMKEVLQQLRSIRFFERAAG